MTPEQIIAATRSMKRRMAVYRRKGEIIMASVGSRNDLVLEVDPCAELIGVYGATAKPEWIEADLRGWLFV